MSCDDSSSARASGTCSSRAGRRRSHRFSAILGAAGALLLGGAAQAQAPDQVGQWGPVLDWGVQAKHMVLLPTAEVLVWSTGDNARVWDPSTDASFTPTPFDAGDLHCAAQATLGDGRVIVAGGQGEETHIGTHITGLFDAFTKSWTRGPDMNKARWYATLLTLGDGRVVVTTGDDENKERVLEPEIFDPVANTWTLLSGASRSDTLYVFMYQLPDGRIFQAGPRAETWFLDVTGNGAWLPGPTNSFGAAGYSESSAMYRPGRILVSGGNDPAVRNAAVIDMNAPNPQWHDVEPMEFARRRHDLTILADGSVIAVGGTGQADDDAQAVFAAEIFDPDTEQWTTVASMAEARMYHSSTVLLPDGRVVAGGGEGGERRKHAQIYSPPYLFKGPRPVISAAPDAIGYGAPFVVGSPDAAGVVSVALIRGSAVTHTYDHNQRYVPLSFTLSGSDLVVDGPPDAFTAAPGYYMLVLKNAAGVPSVARIVRLAAAADLVPGAFAGTVSDAATGTPIAGATVTYPGDSDVTDASGHYQLDAVPAGTHTLQATAAGFAAVSHAASTVGGATTTVDFALTLAGRVEGRVTAFETGLPIAGANVGWEGGSATTDADGRYAIASIASGLQTLTATSVIYSSEEATVDVPAGGTAVLDFALHPGETVIEGEVLDALTLEPVPFATVSYDGGSLTADFVGFYIFEDVEEGTHVVVASAPGYVTASAPVEVVTGFESTQDFSLMPVDAPVVFLPEQDALVKSSNVNSNYGAEDFLRTRAESGGTTYQSYLQFDVGAASPLSAKLRLFVTDASPDGGTLYALDQSFDESQITWTNAPVCGGTPIASLGAVSVGEWVEADVSAAVSTPGVHGFCLASASTNSALYSSKEGLNPPQLVVSFSGTAGETALGGRVVDAETQAPIEGATVSFGGGSTLTDASGVYVFHDVAPEIYEVTASAPGYEGSSAAVAIFDGVQTVQDFSLAPVPTQAGIFLADQDARVKSSSPDSNYDDDYLRVRADVGGTIYASYLQFDVGGLSGPPVSATLRLFTTDGSSDGGTLYALGEAFDETRITWGNAPACGGTPVASLGAVADGEWVEVDVTSAVTATGAQGFCLVSASTNSARYSSREGANPPELVIDVATAAGCTADAECDDGIGCTVDSCDTGTGVCVYAPNHSVCDDGFFCNGVESCDASAGCVPAPAGACPAGICDEAFDVCTGPATTPTPSEVVSGSAVGSAVVATAGDVGAAAGNLYLAAISTKPHASVVGVTGLGLVWSEVAEQCGGRSQTGVSLWSAQGAPTGAGPVTATLASVPSAVVLTTTRYSGVPADALRAVVSANSNGEAGACSGGTDAPAWSTLLDVATPGAATYAAVALRQRSHEPDGFTELSEIHEGAGGNAAGLAVGDAVAPDAGTVALGGSFSSNVDWAAVVAEVAAPSGAPLSAELPPVPVPAENPITEAKRVLGKVLFWDEQLSSDDSVACGTCHQPLAGGADPRIAIHPGADGSFGTEDDVFGSAGVVRRDAGGTPVDDPIFHFAPQVTRRSAPVFVGAAFAPELFVDGAAGGTFVDPQTGGVAIAAGGALESQVMRPPLSPVEMAHEGRDWAAVAAKLAGVAPLARASDLPADVAAALSATPTYPALFAAAFGDPAITARRIAFAIATYERTLVPDQTPWDAFMAGDASALTARQQQGWNAFRESLCATCHTPPLFTDQRYHNIGVRPVAEDVGRQAVTGLPEDAGRFRTPTLRNAGLKLRFMHDGSMRSIADSTAFYLDERSRQFPENRDPLMPRVDIDPDDELALIDFLTHGLVDPRVRDQVFPFDRPTLSGGGS